MTLIDGEEQPAVLETEEVEVEDAISMPITG